jgi:phosphoserine phosphatase
MTHPDTQQGGLALGAWNPEVHAALLSLLHEHGVNSPGYDPEKPPLVTLDCDETLICNDIGEAMLRYMVTRRRFHADRGFWQLIPDRMGRDAIQAAFSAVAGRSDAEVKDTAAFRRFRSGLINAYELLREQEGNEAAYLFAARLLRGLHEKSVQELVEDVLDYELDRPLGQEEIAGGPPFPGLLVPAGIRVYRDMLNLIDALDQQGFQTWIVTSSNAYVVRGLARRIGFPEERVLGIELSSQSGMLTDRVVDPAPIGEGKLEVFLDTVGRSPVLAIGDSMNDFDLLENCEGLSIAVDRGDNDELIERAQENGWKIQGTLSVD